ncbi:hypothetical protein PHLCEN_2v11465 [Hermanssonia centrifuga]|uniref:Uncharacterized protein n=1 Tax=Hermanssonia centrifuga TaxID=98765 RepID=A0A2R6NJW7_9APHY|nr:hypothetical protein PHLCEN_2v11465 [Hermanssonia centrifuga]
MGKYEDYCSNFASTPTTSALDRIGASIPEEVLGKVLIFIQRGYYRKHDVGQLALTGRYWAAQCQPAIFATISLRSGQEIDELLSLMASPLSRIASYIKTLLLYHNAPQDPPWLHLVALRLLPKLSLDTEGPIYLLLNSTAAIRSIHGAMPRSHPSFSSHISFIKLVNARFNSFTDLLHLVDEVPSLRELYCKSLTWPASPDTPPVVPRRIPLHLYYVEMNQCTDNSASVRVLTGRGLTGTRRKASVTASLDFGLDPEHWHTIYKVASPCGEKSTTGCNISLNRIDSAYSEHFCYYVKGIPTVLTSMLDMIDVDGDIRIYFILPSTTGPKSPVRFETIAIFIRSYKDGDPEKWNKTCEQLPPLQNLVLGFDSVEDMTRFIREVVSTKLDDLRSADRVKYTILKGKYCQDTRGMWLRASVDSKELKETGWGKCDLWRI